MPKVPWSTLLSQLPLVMRAVDTLVDTVAIKNAARSAAPAIESLQARVTALEEQQRASADLLKQLAEHVNTVAVAAQETSAMLRRTLIMASVGSGLALVAFVMALWLLLRG